MTLVGGRYRNTKAGDQAGPVYTPVVRERQEEAVGFLIDEVFETPTWLAEPAILRRIEHAGAVERIRGRQVSVLNSLLDPGRLQRLIESELFDEDAYPLADYLGDLRDGIWSAWSGS